MSSGVIIASSSATAEHLLCLADPGASLNPGVPRPQGISQVKRMRIAVAGGTGVVGRYVVEAVRAAGHETVAISRSTGVDLVTGTGLADALKGADVVIDVSNTTSL